MTGSKPEAIADSGQKKQQAEACPVCAATSGDILRLPHSSCRL